MFFNYYFCLLLSFNAIVTIYSEEYFKATNIECATSPKYFTNHSCRLKAVNRYKTMAFMEAHIKDILRNISVNIALYIRNDANNFNPFLVNVTQNMCSYLDKKLWGAYLNIFMKGIASFSNVNHSCPFVGRLIVTNGFLDRPLVPVPVPKGLYKFVFTLYEGYPLDYMANVSYYVELLETKTKETAKKRIREKTNYQ